MLGCSSINESYGVNPCIHPLLLSWFGIVGELYSVPIRLAYLFSSASGCFPAGEVVLLWKTQQWWGTMRVGLYLSSLGLV